MSPKRFINKKIEKMADEAKDMSQEDIKKKILYEINNNEDINMAPDIKEKINNGDIDGLKSEIIKQLASTKNSNNKNEKFIDMLKNDDMDGLKNELLSMLMNVSEDEKKK